MAVYRPIPVHASKAHGLSLSPTGAVRFLTAQSRSSWKARRHTSGEKRVARGHAPWRTRSASDNPKTGRITALSVISYLRKLGAPLRVGSW